MKLKKFCDFSFFHFNLILLVLSIVISLPLFFTKISDPWILRTVYSSKIISLEKTIFPVFILGIFAMYVHRPLVFLIYKMFFIFNWEIMYKIYQFLSFFLFGVSVFAFFYLLSRNKFLSFFTAVLSLIMPSAIISFFVSDTDVFGTALVFFTAIFYLSYINLNKKQYILFFYLFSVLAIFYKESTKAFLILFLFILSYYLIKAKKMKLTKIIKIITPVLIIFLLFSLPDILTPKPFWFNLEFSIIQRLPLMFSFIWVQLLFATGIFLPLLIVYKRRSKIRNFIGFGLTIFLIFICNTQHFSHFLGMFMPNILYPFGIIGIIIIAYLIYDLKKEKNSSVKFSFISFLLWVLTIFFVISFVVIYREDISSRAFIYSIPFIVFLSLNRFLGLKDKLSKKFFLITFSFGIITCITFIFYFSLSSSIFYNLYYKELNYVFYSLSNSSSNEVLVLYVNPLLPVENIENKVLFDFKNLPKITYWYLDANTFSSKKFLDLEKSICDRLQTTKNYYDKLYIIEIKEVLHKTNLRERVKFKWVKNSNLPSLFKLGHPAGISPYSTNFPQYYFSLHDPEYDTDLYFSTSNISPVFFEKQEIKTIFPKYPFIKNVKIEGRVYMIENPFNFFGCKGLFTQEYYKNETFFWIWRKAEIMIFNNDKEKDKYIRFVIWPFHHERNLTIILNNETFNLSIPRKGMRITIPIPLKKDLNTLQFISPNGCDIPEKVGAWKFDIRCLSFGIKDLQIIDLSDGWFPKETYKNISFRWMGKEGKIKFYVPEKGNYTILMDAFSFNTPRKVNVHIGNNTYEFLIPTSGERIEIPVYFERKGNYTLFLKSNCSIPFLIGSWNVWECISIGVLIKNFTNVIPPFIELKKN